ncbi:hypothetical protein [Sporomusa termitida]|nr:hypothetical protein [Sporomusa termitida]
MARIACREGANIAVIPGVPPVWLHGGLPFFPALASLPWAATW